MRRCVKQKEDLNADLVSIQGPEETGGGELKESVSLGDFAADLLVKIWPASRLLLG